MRKPENWIKSVARHFGGTKTLMREVIYGKGFEDPLGHEQHYLDTYNKHNRDVQEYFKGRKDFLVFNSDEGDGWEKLCKFLGDLPVPNEPFPTFNVNRGSEEVKKKVPPSALNRKPDVPDDVPVFERPGYDIVRLPYGKSGADADKKHED
jgi:hypothetical protein